MLSPLADRVYRHLFMAQLLSLLGTGLATVALGLLAFQLAGAGAGAVLGTALAIKMVAYIVIAPVAGGFVHLVPRRALLVTLDVVRALVALALPFVTQIWQIYELIFLLQSCSAAFTPTFQATIPDVLEKEEEYTKALSLSRLAYDLEALVSPMLATALLTIINFHWLFGGTALGFIASAALVVSVAIPSPKPAERNEGAWARITRGVRIYFPTPRLRGLLALNLAVAAASAMVIVNTVVLVKAQFGFGDREVAWALSAYGLGSMLAALTLPRLLEKLDDRSVMLAGGAALILGMALGTAAAQSLSVLMAIWLLLGVGNGCVLTPSGRLLRRSSSPVDRPALFAAQFAISHACWLLTYPIAGWLGAAAGTTVAFATLTVVALLGTAAAAAVWPRNEPAAIEHSHPDIPADHPHLASAKGNSTHVHPYVIDDLHAFWPRG